MCANRAGPTCDGQGSGVGVVRCGAGLPDRTTPQPNPPPQGGRERWRRASGFATLAIVALLGLASAANAQDSVEAFYQGRQINLVVGYGPGGGYDLTARLLARHIGRFIPGHPSVVVQNMPGAGSLRAANWLVEAAPKDGGTIGSFGSDIAMIALLGTNPAAQLDARKFTWLGSSSSFGNDAYVLVVRADAKSPSIAAARQRDSAPLLLGGTGEGARDADVPKILRDALGLNLKQVLGYPDSPSLLLAVERGELEGRMFDFSWIKQNRPAWFEPGSRFNVLLQFARETRHPDLAGVPTARELALDDNGRALIAFAETPLLTMARPFAAPPGVPDDRAKALRDAFFAAHRDPQFLAEAARMGLEISPVDANGLVRGIERMAQSPPAVAAYMKTLMTRH
jgi:tripartite-type tricarboxylate transporter receptor subunit TctC